MDVRCGACNKLFRVSDDKITGSGIKFSCTGCGDYVRISQEDLRKDILSRSTASVLDLFKPKPGPATAPLSPETEVSAADQAATTASELSFEPAATTAPEDMREEEDAPSFFEPVHGQPASGTEPEPEVEPRPEPLMLFNPEPPVEPQPEPQEETIPSMEADTITAPSPPASPDQLSTRNMETPPPVASTVSAAEERAEQERVTPSAPSRSGRLVLIVFGTLIVLGLAGYGVFVYLQQSLQKEVEAPAPQVTSIEGLQVVNPVGAMDANGDLIVTGIIENAADSEKTAWYMVIEVYDAQGAVLSKIKLLNGNQIYSRRDYDILAKRGMNIQDYKLKLLQRNGVVIPPKGQVKFEARSVQPPAGIASFIAQVLPFDRVQLDKEIADEMY